AASAEYFRTMRIPVQAGEQCRRALPASGSEPPVYEMMVNRAFVDRYLSDRPSPIGLHLREVEGPIPASRIVGVVADARERGLDREPGPTVDRKSTRLNSSHVKISYAVFCLKKKTRRAV